MNIRHVRRTVAVGPVFSTWGSWDWVGQSLLAGLPKEWQVIPFSPWNIPNADAVIVVKQAPPLLWTIDVAMRAALIYCPIDFFGALSEITAARDWLSRCDQVVVHCQKLAAHFQPYAPTHYLDHPLKFNAPLRKSFLRDGRLLWVGVRSNLPPLAEWVNRHGLPVPLDVLTNPEVPGDILDAAAYGFHRSCEIQIHEWTPERHREFTAQARAVLDIKGDDFRSRHKPPAKAIDFIASGVPVALNSESSPKEHLASLGLDVPTPAETDRWLSEQYWQETLHLGRRLLQEVSPMRVAAQATHFVELAIEAHACRTIRAIASGEGQAANKPVLEETPDVRAQTTGVAAAATATPQLFGLMITKADHSIFREWCRDQLKFYDAVVCLDGSEDNETAKMAEEFKGTLIYLHERDYTIPHPTNHGLRRIVHGEIVRRFGAGHWIMCCHPDEFCYHDPRKIAARADREGYDQVSWYALHHFPHPDELSDWESRRHLPIPERYRHFHWDYRETNIPWIEDRLYRDNPRVVWDDRSHATVRPNGLVRSAPFRPVLRHFKVLEPDPSLYVEAGNAAHHRTRWGGLQDRTGLPFAVGRLDDFFVTAVPNYQRCDRFENSVAHVWNIGDEFRPSFSPPTSGEERQRYEEATRLVATGDNAEAIEVLEAMNRPNVDSPLRALVQNDLAALRALHGETVEALAGFESALLLDPTCSAARTNLRTLGRLPSDFVPAATPSRDEAQVTIPPPRRPVRVAILSLLFNWPSTGGGTVHTAELGRFLALGGFEVRHFYARFDPWGVGQVTAPTPYPAEAIRFIDGDWTAETIVQKFRAAIAAFNPDYSIITDSWNSKPLLAEAVRPRRYILRLQALECLCPLNNVRLLFGDGGRPMQCPNHQLARPDICIGCVRDRGHSSGDLHRAERKLSGFGTSGYSRRLLETFAEAEAVLVVNPLSEAMVSPYARAVRVVTAGMDPERFPSPVPKQVVGSQARHQILFAGLVGEWMKGFHVIREACSKLWARRQDFELVVTDDLPNGMSPDVFTRYIGWQSQSELPNCLRAADILVMPTVAQEALGRTAVEAMAAGRPVVASRIGGLPFTVADGATGLLFEVGNSTDLASKLTALLDDPELRGRLGQAGRQRFEEHYAWPVIIERHYRPLLLPIAGNPS
jgi:glycosyltransferase involved in cell wall biosynthesis